MIERILYVTMCMKCCRDSEVVYEPQSATATIREEKEEFKTSLVIWRDRVGEMEHGEYRKVAEEECEGMGTPRLCYFSFVIDNVEEIYKSYKESKRLITAKRMS